MLGPAVNGWLSILPSVGPDESVSEGVARRLPCHVLHLAVHDDDILFYFFYLNGKLVDQYNSWPDYFDAASDEEIQKSYGRPERFMKLWPTTTGPLN